MTPKQIGIILLSVIYLGCTYYFYYLITNPEKIHNGTGFFCFLYVIGSIGGIIAAFVFGIMYLNDNKLWNKKLW